MSSEKFTFDVEPYNLIVDIGSQNESDALSYLQLCEFDCENHTLRCPLSKLAKILAVRKKLPNNAKDLAETSSLSPGKELCPAKPVNLRKRGRGYEWADEETNCLINICKIRREEERMRPGEKRSSWKSVVDAMAIEGFERSVEEVKAKWKREVKKLDALSLSSDILEETTLDYDEDDFTGIQSKSDFAEENQNDFCPIHINKTPKNDQPELLFEHSSDSLITTLNNEISINLKSEIQSSPMVVQELFTAQPNSERMRKRGKGSEWSETATKTLINICRLRRVEDLKFPMCKGASKWRDVANYMASEGYEKTVDEVKSKWDREKKKFLADQKGSYPYSEEMKEILSEASSQNGETFKSSENTLEFLKEKYRQSRTSKPAATVMTEEGKRNKLFAEYLKLQRQKFDLKKEELEETKRFHDSLLKIGESFITVLNQRLNPQCDPS